MIDACGEYIKSKIVVQVGREKAKRKGGEIKSRQINIRVWLNTILILIAYVILLRSKQ